MLYKPCKYRLQKVNIPYDEGGIAAPSMLWCNQLTTSTCSRLTGNALVNWWKETVTRILKLTF